MGGIAIKNLSLLIISGNLISNKISFKFDIIKIKIVMISN